ncbi:MULTISPECIES: hypothetical protein [Cysteiniphilum]|uniref:hypothetical protein n=1 Tax=Cysteiniphilum TaxID=2056696 RepID=UPI00177FB3DD|nr:MULTISPECIES: hypothetical protein [Cysteiniphilum]
MSPTGKDNCRSIDNGDQCSIEEMNITTAQHANGIVDHNNNVTITESEDNDYLSQF